MARVGAITVLAVLLAGCGKFSECYDAQLVGSAGYYITVAAKEGGRRREIHTTADSWTVGKVAGWAAGDELIVCNNIVTNKTRGESAQCGDSGCLAFWP